MSAVVRSRRNHPHVDENSSPTRPAATSSDVQANVFWHSYSEVLLFLKHQDDKINRVLTALAFLTAAGVTLYIFSGSDRLSQADYPRFTDSGVRIDDYFFGSFIVGVAVSVALALVSLDPTSYFPRFLGQTAVGERSLLYYAAINEQSDDWGELLSEIPANELLLVSV